MRWMATKSPHFRDSEVIQWIETQQEQEQPKEGIDRDLPVAQIAEPAMIKATALYMSVPVLPAFNGLAL